MNDPDDIELKAEIDKIMTNVHNTLKKIETIEPDKNHDLSKGED